MATYYADNTLHNDGGPWTATGGTLTTVVCATMTFTAPDTEPTPSFIDYSVLMLTGANAGESRRITNWDNPTRTVTVNAAFTNVVAANDDFEITVGGDANTGANEGTGATGALRTLNNTIRGATNGDTIYIKGGRAYSTGWDMVDANENGGINSTHTIIGYTTTPGDGGLATIDGDDTYDHCWTGSCDYYIVSNMVFTGALGSGFDANLEKGLYLTNCYATYNGDADETDRGFFVGAECRLIECVATNNRGTGIQVGTDCVLIGCVAEDNGASGILIGNDGVSILSCRSRGNATIYADHGQISLGAYQGILIAHCFINGLDKSEHGINTTGGVGAVAVVMNNIVVKCNEGISWDRAYLGTDLNNLFYDNTTDYVNWTLSAGSLVDPPSFDDDSYDAEGVIDTNCAAVDTGYGAGAWDIGLYMVASTAGGAPGGSRPLRLSSSGARRLSRTDANPWETTPMGRTR